MLIVDYSCNFDILLNDNEEIHLYFVWLEDQQILMTKHVALMQGIKKLK